MIESNLVIEDIIKREPSLERLYTSQQTDWSNQFKDAFTEVVEDIRARNFNIRKLGKRLSLETSVTKTAAFDGTKSSEDLLNRLRYVIDITAIDSSAVFELQGTNDSTSETYRTVESITIDTVGKTTAKFIDTYKFYRLKLVSVTSITYSAYLIETSFERLHLYKTLQLIYSTQKALIGDIWADKAEEYRVLYLDCLEVSNFAYDEDDDGSIEDIEKNRNNSRVRLRP